MMTVDPAALAHAPAGGGSQRFVPTGHAPATVEDFDYVEEEWFASGKAEGHPYTTSLTVRRPRDPSRFSGVVVVEPVHAASAAPIWIYTSTYQMRSGHGWVAVCSQKSVLDNFVKPANPERYADLEIWSDTPPPEIVGDRLHPPASRSCRHSSAARADAATEHPLHSHPGAGRGSAGDRRRALCRAGRASRAARRPFPDGGQSSPTTS